MCFIRDNIPADVWAEVEAIASAPRYATNNQQQSNNYTQQGGGYPYGTTNQQTTQER